MTNALTTMDVNLLVALDVLLQERHVTRAARRLGVSQPAASQMLGRLRDQLDDQLLVRHGQQMHLTERAQRLQGPLRQALAALDAALVDAPFDVANSTYTFRVAMLDVYASWLIPELVAVLAKSGPGLTLEVDMLKGQTTWDDLDRRALDLAIIGPTHTPDSLNTKPLFLDHIGCLVHKTHPILASDPITPQDYVQWPHVNFTIKGSGVFPIDVILQELGLSRRVVCTIPYFQTAPMLATQPELIVNMPWTQANLYARMYDLRTFVPPLDLRRYPISVAWSTWRTHEPALEWLIDTLSRCVREGQAV